MIRRRAFWVAAATAGATVAAMFCVPPAALWAKPGAVTDNDGVVYVGDVTEAGTKFTVKDDTGAGIEIDKSNVRRTTYFETAQDEFAARIGALKPNDARGRVAVARWAVKHNEPALARQAVDAALKLEPTNAEALSLRKTLDQSAPVNPPPATNVAPAAVKPRLVTKEEINRIRQAEWQPNEDAIRVTIDKETRAAFMARARDLTPAQFNRMSPVEQARLILREGTDKMKAGVHVMMDPATIQNYRRNVQKSIVTGCAAAGCHDAAGDRTPFSLFNEGSDEAAYANFLILQNYRTRVGGVVRLMIDRDQPAESLLSEFALAPKIAQTPHPEVPGYAGLFRNVQDQRFKLLSQWIRGLPTIPPNYGVDLSKPPEGPASPAAAEHPEPANDPAGGKPAAGDGKAPAAPTDRMRTAPATK